MPAIRPIIAVRLIGPSDVVTAQKNHLAAYFAKLYQGKATCRISTHPARHCGEIRAYLTVTRKENDGLHSRARSALGS
jgi:hypothetical protein